MSMNVIRDMNEFGVCVLDNFIGEERGKRVLEEVHNIHNAGYFKVRIQFYPKLLKLIKSLSSIGWTTCCK